MALFCGKRQLAVVVMMHRAEIMTSLWQGQLLMVMETLLWEVRVTHPHMVMAIYGL